MRGLASICGLVAVLHQCAAFMPSTTLGGAPRPGAQERSCKRSRTSPAVTTAPRGVVLQAGADDMDPREKEMPKFRDRPTSYSGKCYVVKDNIDTDQIIPAEYLTLVPTKPDEYEKLGAFALIGLPAKEYPTKYVPEGEVKTPYPIVIAGDNFGCGSSREHAPIAMGACGNRVVVAESYARIFFRNCIATGELYPYETPVRLVEKFTTGDEVTVDLEKDTIVNTTTGETYSLNSLGDAGPVINAGGIFPFAIKSGMIKKGDA